MKGCKKCGGLFAPAAQDQQLCYDCEKNNQIEALLEENERHKIIQVEVTRVNKELLQENERLKKLAGYMAQTKKGLKEHIAKLEKALKLCETEGTDKIKGIAREALGDEK